ncbi:MAG: hypothetical protein FWE31_05120 [Firmicutes bacterium]|nr:hypothetical protein [Bacillota bacterium]
MRKLLIIAIILIIGIGIGVMIFLLTRGGQNHLVVGAQYEVREIRPNTFANPNGTAVSIIDNPTAYITFNAGFEIMTMSLATHNYNFTITRLQERRNSVTIEMVGIIRGQIVPMRLVANQTTITIRATMTTSVAIESDDGTGTFRETINRNEILLVFSIPQEVTP